MSCLFIIENPPAQFLYISVFSIVLERVLTLSFSSSQIRTYHLKEKSQNLLQQGCRQGFQVRQAPRVQLTRYRLRHIP